jgi:NADH-quinone oxidoreductase subunit J
VNDQSTLDIAGPFIVILLGGIGTYLLLPHRHGWLKPRWAHVTGAVLASLAALLLATFWPAPGPFLTSLFFYVFALAAIAGAILMITSRNPVYSALWFATVVLATAGLFLLAGAQFLAAGTVIVYAGAIIVTFLFVIMLAQAEGQAVYDRAARSPARASISCFVLLWCLIYALLSVKHPPKGGGVIASDDRLLPATRLAAHYKLKPSEPAVQVLDRAVSATARLPAPGGVHVAGLGGTLYTDNLLAVEIAGAILFVAMIGAASIATPKPPVRPGAMQTAKPSAARETSAVEV